MYLYVLVCSCVRVCLLCACVLVVCLCVLGRLSWQTILFKEKLRARWWLLASKSWRSSTTLASCCRVRSFLHGRAQQWLGACNLAGPRTSPALTHEGSSLGRLLPMLLVCLSSWSESKARCRTRLLSAPSTKKSTLKLTGKTSFACKTLTKARDLRWSTTSLRPGRRFWPLSRYCKHLVLELWCTFVLSTLLNLEQHSAWQLQFSRSFQRNSAWSALDLTKTADKT